MSDSAEATTVGQESPVVIDGISFLMGRRFHLAESVNDMRSLVLSVERIQDAMSDEIARIDEDIVAMKDGRSLEEIRRKRDCERLANL